ncbi:leucine-rich repeat extensin-like protein 5 [Nothobranchius furzeri]|uniref:Leucine-rich repeat extensin-like protein 5 n=2 Tax=Nothobranchius furzeri TaxID=105023 RepID=A0A9D2YHM9_NOTFU|nr:leucine-rich repeat extensin-like protein 5 [Nothobranchius furzeri]
MPPKPFPAGQDVSPTSVPAGQNLPNAIGQPPSQYYSVNMPLKPFPAGQDVPPTSVPAGQNLPNTIGQPPSQYYSVNMPPKPFPAVQDVPPTSVPAGQDIPNTVDQLSSNFLSANVQPPSSPSLNTAEWYGQNNVIDSTEYASPPKKPSPQSQGKSRSEDWWDYFFSNFFGDEDLDEDLEPQNSVIGTEKYWFPQVGFSSKAQEPLTPPPPRPQIYIVHTKGNYKRGRVVHTKSVYSPKYETPILKYPKGSKASGGPSDNLSNLLEDHLKNDGEESD